MAYPKKKNWTSFLIQPSILKQLTASAHITKVKKKLLLSVYINTQFQSSAKNTWQTVKNKKLKFLGH